jgi:hypothetical protein
LVFTTCPFFDILEKLASVRSELTRKHNKPMGNLQVIEALFGKWFGDTDNRNTDVPVCPSTYVEILPQIFSITPEILFLG